LSAWSCCYLILRRVIFLQYEELSSWSCCCLTSRRPIFLQLWRVLFLELLISHHEKTDLPATQKSCLPGAVAISPW
jgi:hypothetical protein